MPVTQSSEVLERLKLAFHAQDAVGFSALLDRHPEFKALINEPVAAFDAPLITHVRRPEMLDALLRAGADINAKSRWWAGGFGLLHTAEPALAAYAIQRGAFVDIHAAARLGLMERVRELLAAEPDLVNARGGDGQTPLHFASSIEIAETLLAHGAKVDARDVDHESTPAQYMVRDRQAIARYLIGRGCHTDILLAAALGDPALVRRHLDERPDCIRMRVSDDYFPKANPRSGGTIYQWTLGWHVSAHDVAREFQRADVLAILNERSPADVLFLEACWAADDMAAKNLLMANPNLLSRFSEIDRHQVAHAARNNNAAAVRIMLDAGLPVDAVGQHRATPLHWAAFHGNAEMVTGILRHHPPLEQLDADFQSTPLGWAIHGSEHGWHCSTGDYARTVELLLDAGASVAGRTIAGTPPVQELLRRRGVGQ